MSALSKLKSLCYQNARKKYGDPLPKEIEDRLEWELQCVETQGSAVSFYAAAELAKCCEDLGYLHGARGTLPSTLIRVIESIRNTKTADSPMSFRNHTRSADVFLFDDIDDLAACELNMAEFRFLFDYLYEHGKQIVITGHEPVDQLEGIDERILSRLAWGKCVKISHRTENECENFNEKDLPFV